MYLEMIREIVENCEAIQDSHESDYTKEQAKKFAYEQIKELLIGKENE